MVWMASGTVWSIGLWLTRSSGVVTLPTAGMVSVAIAAAVAMAAWRVPIATAEVLPPVHRAIAKGDIAASNSGSAVSLVTMIETSEPAPTTYTVRSGDCLWRIARASIVAEGVKPTGAMIATLWREIYDVNVEVIGANPRLIFPGQVLEMPER